MLILRRSLKLKYYKSKSYYNRKKQYRRSSLANIVPSYLYGNFQRVPKQQAQTKGETWSILKHWRHNFHTVKRWSFSNYSIYRISNRTQRMWTLLDHNFQTKANNMSWMWFNNKPAKGSHTIPGRSVILSWP